VTIAWVMPAGTGLVRNGFGCPRLYSGKPFGVPCGGTLPPTGNGTVFAKANFGTVTVKAVPSAARALPCGIVARRVTLAVSTGSVVDGTLIQMPGSRWSAPPSVASLICCR